MRFQVVMTGLIAAALAGPVGAAELPVSPAPPVQIMVLGAYHFGNPGLDKVNVKVDDVTSARHQRELAVLAEEIAAFQPTRVMVESQRPGPTHDDPGYLTFTPARLLTDRNETVQIGYRIAALAGLKTVQGIDEQPGAGEPDYFPMDTLEAYAKTQGQAAALDAAFGAVRAEGAKLEAAQASASIPRLLDGLNDPASAAGGQDLYYTLLAFGDGDRQPGADLNAMWYLRNAKIFAKLMNVAKPGDRVLVVYGAGHGYWLRHFATTVPGYALVDVRPYLQRAAGRLE